MDVRDVVGDDILSVGGWGALVSVAVGIDSWSTVGSFSGRNVSSGSISEVVCGVTGISLVSTELHPICVRQRSAQIKMVRKKYILFIQA